MSGAAFNNATVRTFFALAILFVCLATLAVLCRFISQRLRKVAFAIDDWLVLTALVGTRCKLIWVSLLISADILLHPNSRASVGYAQTETLGT